MKKRIIDDSISPATMTTQQAAAYLGIGRAMLLARAYSGELPSLTIGSRRLFVREALDRWLLERAEAGR